MYLGVCPALQASNLIKLHDIKMVSEQGTKIKEGYTMRNMQLSKNEVPVSRNLKTWSPSAACSSLHKWLVEWLGSFRINGASNLEAWKTRIVTHTCILTMLITLFNHLRARYFRDHRSKQYRNTKTFQQRQKTTEKRENEMNSMAESF